MQRVIALFLCFSTCDECMMDLTCGFCYSEKDAVGVTNSSCLPTDIDNPWISSVGRCKTYNKGQQLSWAYDYCPSPYSWMPLVGLILYLVSFAPGKYFVGCFVVCCCTLKASIANSVDGDQTASSGGIRSQPLQFADHIFSCFFSWQLKH